MNLQTVSIIVTILLAAVGLVGKYAYDLRLARRKDTLELVNKQLNEFYGPLFVATQAGAIAAEALRKKLGQKAVFVNRQLPTAAELAEWRVWLPNVLMPINDFREQLILKNAHLIRETDFPPCLLQFVAHVAAYKAVLKRWEEGDFEEILSIIDFPRELESYSTRSYTELKHEQARLIGLTTPIEKASIKGTDAQVALTWTDDQEAALIKNLKARNVAGDMTVNGK